MKINNNCVCYFHLIHWLPFNVHLFNYIDKYDFQVFYRFKKRNRARSQQPLSLPSNLSKLSRKGYTKDGYYSNPPVFTRALAKAINKMCLK